MVRIADTTITLSLPPLDQLLILLLVGLVVAWSRKRLSARVSRWGLWGR